jgi:hypothetical protein
VKVNSTGLAAQILFINSAKFWTTENTYYGRIGGSFQIMVVGE